MSPKSAMVSDVLRRALKAKLASGVTRYRVSVETNIPITTLTTFLKVGKGEAANRTGRLTLATVDRLAAYLGLEMVEKNP